MNKRLSIIAMSLLTVGCTPISPENLQNGDDFSNVGLEIQWVEEQEVVDAIDPKTINAVKELQESYDAAIAVRDLMLELSTKISDEDRAAMSGALDAFSADIDALKYYVDTATYDELTDEEHGQLVEITTGIENGMAVFGDILEVLL